ncbi:unnamed protein product [Ascophyllum nodosum]
MALVPLEARLESKERAWREERNELIFKVEENQRSLGVVEERCRELEKRRSDMEQERQARDAEVRRLRGELRQHESNTAESFWKRSVAATSDIKRMETERDYAQAKVVTLTTHNAELKARASTVQGELASSRARLSEAEKVASRALAAEESLRFSQTQLEIMKAEFAATCAQLAAVQTELAHQNASASKKLQEIERKAGDDKARLMALVLPSTIPHHAVHPLPSGGSAALVSSEAARIRQEELEKLRGELDHERERTRFLQESLDGAEKERRSTHNIIQDLKGSVRVYVRTRPFLKSDGEAPRHHDAAIVRVGSDACSVSVIPPDAPRVRVPT